MESMLAYHYLSLPTTHTPVGRAHPSPEAHPSREGPPQSEGPIPVGRAHPSREGPLPKGSYLAYKGQGPCLSHSVRARRVLTAISKISPHTLRTWELAEIRHGEATLLTVSSLRSRYGWPSAAEALMRRAGSATSIIRSRSIACGSTFWYRSPVRLNSMPLFFLQTSSYLVPSKSGLRVSRMWKMTPTENMSHSGLTCPLSVKAMISGATQPGVPQRQNRYFSCQVFEASPKSTMTGSSEDWLRSMMFSGLRSRCMMCCLCILASPETSPSMHSLTSGSVKFPLRSWMRWKSCPPVSSSSTTQIELSDSQTPSRWSTFLWGTRLSPRMTESSLIRLSLPRLAEKQLCLLKALTANLCPSSIRSTSQTVAKLPLPSFLRGLNRQWKPFW